MKTAIDKVKEIYPKAICNYASWVRFPYMVVVESKQLGSGLTSESAWRNALKKISR